MTGATFLEAGRRPFRLKRQVRKPQRGRRLVEIIAVLSLFALFPEAGRAQQAVLAPAPARGPMPGGMRGGGGLGIAQGLLGLGLGLSRLPPRSAPIEALPPSPASAGVGPRRPIRARPPSRTARREVAQPKRLPQPPHPPRPDVVSQPGFAAVSPLPPLHEGRLAPGEALVVFKDSVSPAQIADFTRAHGLRDLSLQTFGLLQRSVYRFDIGARSPRTAVQELRRDRRVDFVQPNYHYDLLQTASAPAIQSQIAQYADDKLELPKAHDLSLGRNVVIALIDSAVDKRHEVFKSSHIDELDALDGEQPPAEHGTEMASAIAASDLLTGVAPASHILAITAFASGEGSASAEGNTWVLLHALDLAAQGGAAIVNMSFAGPPDPFLARAIAAGQNKGMIFVAAAGNAGPSSPPLFPAAIKDVLAVGATDVDDRPYADENRGDYVVVAAPGVDVLAAAPGGYTTTTGTSVAAALVSGVVALMLETKHNLTESAISSILRDSAANKSPRDPGVAPGPIDARSALVALAQRPPNRLDNK